MIKTIVESSYVSPFAVDPGASLEEFLLAWGRAYIVRRSWRILPGRPPTLVEEERARIETEVNRDLGAAGREERICIEAEMAERPYPLMDLVLVWREVERSRP